MNRFVIVAGFSMFAMFFGSGNFLFPLKLGVQTIHESLWALPGFFITAVGIPFLGLWALILYQGDRDAFFAPLGSKVTFLITALLLSLMGPFGIIPRCTWVAFGGITLMFPDVPFFVFSLLFCLLIALITWRKEQILDIIAYILTPLKFGSIAFLIVAGLYFAPSLIFSGEPSLSPFLAGVQEGYQTMDLAASIFFACTIYSYLSQKMGRESNLSRLSLQASLWGAGLLMVVYWGFVVLGAKLSLDLVNIPMESRLPVAAQKTMGVLGLPLVSFVLAISCLVIATILTSLFSDFLREDILRSRISRSWAIFLTLALSFSLSLLGFQTIYTILGTILVYVYPFLVFFAIFRIQQALRRGGTL